MWVTFHLQEPIQWRLFTVWQFQWTRASAVLSYHLNYFLILHNTLTLCSKVTIKKSKDTHRIHTVYDIWNLTNVATSAHHRSLTWARLIQSMPSNTTSLIYIVLLSFEMLSYIQVFLLKLSLDISQLSFKLHFPPIHTYHVSKSIKLTQTFLDGRMWCHDHSKHYCLILFHLSHKQKVKRILTLWRRNFLLNFSTPVFKMWIIQEPKKVALWNKRHFDYAACLKYSVRIFVE